MEIFFHFTVELPDIRGLVLHCSNPFSVFAHWRLQVSYYILLVNAEYWTRIGFRVIQDVTNYASESASGNQRVNEYKKTGPFKEINSIKKGPTCIHYSRRVKRSLAGAKRQARVERKGTVVWLQWDSTVKPRNRAAHVEKEDCPFSQPRLY